MDPQPLSNLVTKYREQFPGTDSAFNNPVTPSEHADEDKHLIGEALPAPTIINPSGSDSIGESSIPAREDHSHSIPNPLTPWRIGLENGSAALPSLYWPNAPGLQKLGFWYDSGGSGGVALTSNGSTIINMASGAGITSGPGVDFVCGSTGASFYGDQVYALANNRVRIGSTVKNVRIGAWTGNTAWSAVEGTNGYLLLGDGGNDVFLRTASSTHNLHLGTNGLNRLTIRNTDGLATFSHQIQNANMPATGTGTGFQDVYRDNTFGILHRFTSQRAVKTQIKPFKNAGEIIDGLKPVTFISRGPVGKKEDPVAKQWRQKDLQYGFIAEDVFEVADGHLATVEVDKDGNLIPNGWHDKAFIAVLVAEVQNLRKRVADLESSVR